VSDKPDLVLDGVTVRFGGLVAVDGVSLEAEAGTVTGLIGPNGAGKTTTFNAATGVVTPVAGRVELGGEDLGRLGPAARAERGLGRTFQRMELFDSMTVAENVALGPEMRLSGRRIRTHLRAGRRETVEVRARTEHALAACDLDAVAGRPAADLSTGQRRMVELARAIASRFEFLLLDEPSSGLDGHETERFTAILHDLMAEQGIGLLVVEHDMALVRALCSTIYVLDFGRLIAQGDPSAVAADAAVRAAYLGQPA